MAETAIVALRRLGVERCTGALEISSPAPAATAGPDEPTGPSGRIYLVDGDVAYAEAAAVPGVDMRLVRAGLVPELRWWSLARVLDARRADWDALVDVTRAAAVPDAELERIVRSATADAAVSLLAATGPARCRFHAGAGRWAGRTRRTAVDDLLDEAVAGLRMLAASRVGPDDSVALAPAGDDGVVLAPQLSAVLVGLTDGRTPREAAWQSGLAVLDTVAALSDLADQGACAVVTRRPRPNAGAAPPAEVAPLRCRRRSQPVRPRSGHEPVWMATDTSILTRLIEGLRRE